MKNKHSWEILIDKQSDFILVTRKRLVNWSHLHEFTSVRHLMTSHMFCTLVSNLSIICVKHLFSIMVVP